MKVFMCHESVHVLALLVFELMLTAGARISRPSKV